MMQEMCHSCGNGWMCLGLKGFFLLFHAIKYNASGDTRNRYLIAMPGICDSLQKKETKIVRA